MLNLAIKLLIINLYYSGIASAVDHLSDSFCYLVVVLLSAQEVLEVSKDQSLILNWHQFDFSGTLDLLLFCSYWIIPFYTLVQEYIAINNTIFT